ncbi:hypothetical protein B484DRAFT_472307 [Ochromonadaceae sp. CCMP2298]|nr:hypothetical protein B484DRAFT_472307 [Ochromonadaceae sp. CCMP2298]
MGGLFEGARLAQGLVILLVILLLVLVTIADTHMYEVKRLERTRTYFYLICNNGRVAKRIRDSKTVEALGFVVKGLKEISQRHLAKLKKGWDVPRIQPIAKGAKPSSNTNSQIMLSAAVNGDLVKRADFLAGYLNPAIILYQNRLLMLTRHPDDGWTKRINYIYFAWLDHPSFPLWGQEEQDLLCLDVNDMGPLKNAATVGQDPRIVYVGDTLQVFFNHPSEKIAHMGMFELAVNQSSGCLEISEQRTIEPAENVLQKVQPQQKETPWNVHPAEGEPGWTVHPAFDASTKSQLQSEKNWTPFRHRNETLLLHSINPLVVVKAVPFSEEGGDNRTLLSHMHSVSPSMNIPWPFGDLRGGTNAIYLPKQGVYLSFLHSAAHIGGSRLKTYVMGAYTFTADPPFRVLQVSPLPIMPRNMYEGPYNRLKLARIDYNVFPMHIFVWSAELVLSVGWQDTDAYLIWFNLQDLLDSLSNVEPIG